MPTLELEYPDSVPTVLRQTRRPSCLVLTIYHLLAAFDGPARATRCACAIADSAARLGIEVKTGLHTGECDVLVDKISGIAVAIGSQVAAYTDVGEVLVSHTVKDLVAGSGIGFEERGTHRLHDIPGEWRLFSMHRESPAR